VPLGLALPLMVKLGNDHTAIHMDEELELALKALLKRITTPSTDKASGIKKFFEGLLGTLNSPFVVTLIGGAILALISGYITELNAEKAKALEIRLAESRQKENLINSFPTKVEQYLALTHDLRKREIYLYQWQDQKDKAPYPDGRTFDQTRDKYEEDYRYWNDHSPGSPLGVIYMAKLLFKKPDTLAKLNEIEDSVDTYQRTLDFKQLDDAYNHIADDVSQVISLFASELNEK
jgi:hypothetical protein